MADIEKLHFFLAGLMLKSIDLLGEGDTEDVEASSSSRWDSADWIGELFEDTIVLDGER